MSEFTINVKLSADDTLLKALEAIAPMFSGFKSLENAATQSNSEVSNLSEASKPLENVKKRAPKAESKQAPVAEQEELPASSGPAPEPTAKKYTIEEVRAIAKEVKDEKGADAIRAALNAFGAASVTALDESKYADFVTKIKAA
jgi:hypothetical protein